MSELYRRIDCTRFPAELRDSTWDLGTDGDYLLSLIDFWRNKYDWFQKEKSLNQYPQFTCEIDNLSIHFFHIRSTRKDAIPLLLTHGWPDSFLRYAKLFPLLSNYHLVVPSLPGFAFSALPDRGFLDNAEVADIWHRLMVDVLGYKNYFASGGDMGRGVTCYLAARYPKEIIGIHLTDVGFVGEIVSSPDEKLNSEELDYKRKANKWMRDEGAYINIQSTKPQTLAYLLSDSPVGMAAWITEKYHSWSDWQLMTMNDICDCLTLYWMTNTASTSIRAYHGNSFTLPPLGRISRPTAIAAFPYDVLPAPREWVERNYPVVMYSTMPRGGHFTALEQPGPFAQNITEFISRIS